MTGNPVECVLHPSIWNTTSLMDPLGVGHIINDEYEEDNVGYQIGTVRILFNVTVLLVRYSATQQNKVAGSPFWLEKTGEPFL